MSTFNFKEFAIKQDVAAMKVGTDGVLLGAWTSHKNPQKCLDIGTGTGLISLMLAQKFPESSILGIDIDEKAIQQASENSANSKFKNQIKIQKQDILSFNSNNKFDLICCNPPFFKQTKGIQSKERFLARDTESLPLNQLLKKIKELLSSTGISCLIVPFSELKNIEECAKNSQLCLNEIVKIKGNINADFKRVLITISHQQKELKITELIIEIKRHQYTPEYIALVKDFYLKM